jgi:hypothetical protein
MSSDLIAGVIAIALGAVVVGLGLRRKLSDVTRSGLPQYKRDPEAVSIATELYTGPPRRSQLSPRMRRAGICLYLFMFLGWAALAAFGAQERPAHVILATLSAGTAVGFFLRRPSSA